VHVDITKGEKKVRPAAIIKERKFEKTEMAPITSGSKAFFQGRHLSFEADAIRPRGTRGRLGGTSRKRSSVAGIVFDQNPKKQQFLPEQQVQQGISEACSRVDKVGHLVELQKSRRGDITEERKALHSNVENEMSWSRIWPRGKRRNVGYSA